MGHLITRIGPAECFGGELPPNDLSNSELDGLGDWVLLLIMVLIQCLPLKAWDNNTNR